MRCLLIACFVIFCVCSISWALDLKDPALVGLWLCDDGKGKTLADSSPNKNDATGTFEWVAGKFGGGISITSGSIDVPTSDSVNSVKQISVAAWFNIQTDSDTGIRRQNAFLLEDQSTSEPVPEGFSFRLWTTNGLSSGAYGTTKLNKKEWYHIAGTYDGAVMKLYINGEAEKDLLTDGGAKFNGQWAGNIAAPADTLQLKYGSETYIGFMDEIVIFNRALSADEIKSLTKGWSLAKAVDSHGKLANTWGSIKSRLD